MMQIFWHFALLKHQGLQVFCSLLPLNGSSILVICNNINCAIIHECNTDSCLFFSCQMSFLMKKLVLICLDFGGFLILNCNHFSLVHIVVGGIYLFLVRSFVSEGITCSWLCVCACYWGKHMFLIVCVHFWDGLLQVLRVRCTIRHDTVLVSISYVWQY